MNLIPFALALFALVGIWSAYVSHRRRIATEATLSALRANAYLRNTRGQVVSYAKADAETRAKAETITTERKA